MSFPRYGSYKDSGVAWLGEVPSHWDVRPLKWDLLRNDGGVWGEDADGEDDTAVLRSTDQTAGGNWQIDEPAFRKLSTAEREAALLLEDDLLITKSSGSSLHIGKTTLVTSDIAFMRPCFSNFMQRLRLKQSMSAKFTWYFFNSDLTREQTNYLSNTTTGLANINGGILASLMVAAPVLNEQAIITHFLDRETAKLDALVEAQRRLITLLKEKRQAVISRAVTKGLDPSVPMKPSTIDWLGDVPAHWEVRKFRDMLRETPRYGVLVPDFDPDGVPMLRINDMTTGRAVDRDGLVTISISLSEQYDRTILEPGDVALTVVGTIGETLIADETLSGVNLSRAVARLRMADSCSAEFATWLFKSSAFRIFVDLTCVGTAQRVLNMDDLSAIRLAFPPSAEQAQIVSFLVSEVGQLEALVTEAQQAVAFLTERRAALISAAVTGKIDVRGLAAPSEAVQAA